MKKSSIFKSLILLMTLAVSIVGITSCNEQENYLNHEINNTNNVENCETVKELQNFNNDFIGSSETRDWKFNLCEILSIGLSDFSGASKGASIGGKLGALVGPQGAVIGAAAGGVICGAAASYSAYRMAENIKAFRPYSTSTFQGLCMESFEASYAKQKDMIKLADYKYGIALGLDSCSTKVAILHNKVLDVVEDIDNKGNQETYITKLSQIEKDIINNAEFKKTYNQLSHDPSFNADPNSAMDAVMALFIDGVNNNVNSMTDLDAIIKFYTSTVKNSSDLSQVEKDALLAGFAVMKYSVIYWSSHPSFQ